MSALLDVTVTGSFVLIAALGATRLLSRRSAALRHCVIAAALACAAALPLLRLVVPTWHVDLGIAAAFGGSRPTTAVQPREATLQRPASDGGRVAMIVPQRLEPDAARRNVPAEGVMFGWLMGVMVSSGILLIGVARLRWLASRATELGEGTWVAVARELARHYSLRRTPLVLQSDHPALLVTWGVRQPRVIVPAAASAWNTDRIRLVLGHELAHVQRRDWLIQLGAEVVRCVFWFNPIVWIACRALRQESEQACDDAVLALGIDGGTYATHLVAIARTCRIRRDMWSPAAAIAGPSSLERRVRAMLNARVNREPLTSRAAGIAMAALLLLTAPLAGFEAFAQARFATVSGTVADESGGVLVGTALVFSNPTAATKHEVRTNQSGYFEFVGLSAGDYILEVRHLGFEPLKESVPLGVGETLQKNVTMRVGSVSEVIRVTGERDEIAASRNRVADAPARRRRPCPNPAIGGCIGAPVKLHDVRPLYPSTLKEARLAGTVLIEGQIGTDGKMKTCA
jgi:beta-lactamase regulating signal transducer with metallopeptidase domain